MKFSPFDFQFINLGGVPQFRLHFDKDDNNGQVLQKDVSNIVEEFKKLTAWRIVFLILEYLR